MANEYLKRTPTSTGNRKVFTWAGWVKSNLNNKSGNGNAIFICASANNGSQYHRTRIGRYVVGNDDFGFNHYDGANDNYGTQAVKRDHSNWEHYICAVDTTKEQTTDRVKLYLNGVYQSDLTTVTAINKDLDTYMNGTSIHFVCADGWTASPNSYSKLLMSDVFFVDGQALTPDVFGFYKDGNGYISAGSTQATDFRPGQWMPHSPTKIKKDINRRGGFGVNGFYLPMNDSSNPGADFHCAPNSIITLKGEDLPQPRNGAPTTSDAYVSQLRQEVSTLGFDGVVKFDGDGDYLSLSTTSDFAFGTGDFTVEFWAWIESSKSTTLQPIFDNDYNSAGGLAIAIRHSDSRIFVGDYGSGLNLCQFNAPFALNYWNHFAVVADSGTYKAFVNGTSCSLGSGSATVVNTSKSSGTTEIGRLVGQTSIDTAAFISNLRVVKGTALYTANFTAPTEPLTNVTNTKLLCCNSSTSATAATVTPGTITAVGGAFATRNELTGSISLAVPGISTSTSANLVTNGTFDSNVSGWTATNSTVTWENGQMKVQRTAGGGLTVNQAFTTVAGQRYTISGTINSSTSRGDLRVYNGSGTGGSLIVNLSGTNGSVTDLTGSFTATSTTSTVVITIDNNNGVVYVDNVVVRQEDAPRDYSADIKGSGSNKTLTAAGSAGVGYEIPGYYGSAMTFDGSGDDSIFVPASSDIDLTGDFTIEYWAYLDANVTYSAQLSSKNYYNSSNLQNGNFYLGQIQNGSFGIYSYNGQSSGVSLQYTIPESSRYNQWQHMCFEREGNTLRIYLNGVVVAIDTSWTRSLNDASNGLYIGKLSKDGGTDDYGNLDGKLQDFKIYSGLAKYKGGFDVPKPYTPVGIATWRATTDTCKNNFCTMNSLNHNNATFSDGNLTTSEPQANGAQIYSTMGSNTGKWYYEAHIEDVGSPNTGGTLIGINPLTRPSSNVQNRTAYRSDGNIYPDQGSSVGNSGLAYVAGDIIGVAWDADNKKLWFAKNNTWVLSGDPANGSNPVITYTNTETQGPFVAYDNGTGVQITHLNFGQNPSFSGQTTTGTNADGNGKGLFKYAPPTGFLALCEDNLPTPTIADPGEHFKCVLYTGTATSKSIKKVGFQPDLVWVKKRSTLGDHKLVDSVRGTGFVLESNTTDVEGNETINFTGFNSDGFDLGNTGAGAWNENSHDYVAWCWKAGGAAVSNTDGSITTQVSANQTAGFSIVSYTGNNTAGATIGHGLGKKPSMMIVKERTGASGWFVYHKNLGATKFLSLHDTTAAGTETGNTACWYATEPNTSVFTVGQNGATNENNRPIIAYCWTEIEGYSKFGSYAGNGSTDGPFVYCGFKPALIIWKNASANGNWVMSDSSRDSVNPAFGYQVAESSAIEERGTAIFDFLSNGFKIRNGWTSFNATGNTIIFAAFAESPFQTANAK